MSAAGDPARREFVGASIVKAARKQFAGAKQGTVVIQKAKGSSVMRLEITHLNDDELYSLGNLDIVDVEITIRRSGSLPISQPELGRG